MLAIVPILLHVEGRSGSGVAVAAVFLALWGPIFLFAAPAGFVVDRYDARLVLFAAAAAQAAVAVVLAFVSAVPAIIVLTALLGTGAAFAQPAEFSLIPGVGGADIARTNSYVETSRALGFALGPFAGGLLAAAGGLKLGLLVDAGTFAAIAGVAWVLPRRARDAHLEAGVGRVRDGLVFLFRDSLLKVILSAAFTSVLFMTACAPAEVFFAEKTLDAGDAGYGLLLGTWTVGMVAGGLWLGRRLRGAVAALLAICVQSLGILVPTLWLTLAWACGWFLVGGIAHGSKNVLLRTVIHERVPAGLHGRAFAAYNGLRNFAEVFAVLGGGVLVVALGARWTMALAGLLPLAVGVLALARYQRVRASDPAV